jgi:hypothetical protein
MRNSEQSNVKVIEIRLKSKDNDQFRKETINII